MLNCFLHDAIEEQMTEVKVAGMILDILRNRRRYWELKEEAVDQKGGNENFIIQLKKCQFVSIIHSRKLLL